jgi:hypothetical protein
MAPPWSLSYLTTALSKGKAMLNQNAITDFEQPQKDLQNCSSLDPADLPARYHVANL